MGDNTGPVPTPYWFDPLNVKYDGDGDVNVGEFTRVMFSCGDTKSYHTLPEPEYDAGQASARRHFPVLPSLCGRHCRLRRSARLA